MKQELKHGDVVFFSSTGGMVGNIIEFGQALGEKTKLNSNISHVGVLSDGSTMIEMSREGITSSHTVENISSQGELIVSSRQIKKTLKYKPSDYFVFRYGPTSDPFDRNSLDFYLSYPLSLVQFADCKGGIREGSFPDSKKISEIRSYLTEKMPLQENPEARKAIRYLLQRNDSELKKLLRDALRFRCRELATDLASGIAKQGHQYDSKQNPVGKYFTSGAIASVCFTKCRSGTLQEEHVKKFMEQVQDFDFDESFYCSAFVVYVYGLAVTILEGDWADKEWAINKNLDKVSPSELFSYLEAHPNWNRLNNKDLIPSEREEKIDTFSGSSSLSSSASSSSVTSSSNHYSFLPPLRPASEGRDGVNLHKVIELENSSTCCR